MRVSIRSNCTRQTKIGRNLVQSLLYCLRTACTTIFEFLFAGSCPEAFKPYGATSCAHWSRILPTAMAMSILFTPSLSEQQHPLLPSPLPFSSSTRNACQNSPGRTSLHPTRTLHSHAHNHGVSDLAEGRREAAGDFADFVSAGGEGVGAGGDVGGGGLVAGAGDCVD